MTTLRVRAESWPVRGHWTIARGSVTEIDVVVVEMEAEGVLGRGECRPYPRYGESVDSVIAAIEPLAQGVAGGLDRQGLQRALRITSYNVCYTKLLRLSVKCILLSQRGRQRVPP